VTKERYTVRALHTYWLVTDTATGKTVQRFQPDEHGLAVQEAQRRNAGRPRERQGEPANFTLGGF